MNPSTRRSTTRIGGLLVLLLAAGLFLPAGCKEDAPPPTAQAPTPAPEPTPEPIALPEPIAPPRPAYEPLFDLPAHVTDNYVIYTDAAPEVRADMAMRLEAFRDEYRREMADVYKPFDGKAKALFIGDQETSSPPAGNHTHPASSA